MKCLGLHNKPAAEVHLGHMLTGRKEEEEEPLGSESLVLVLNKYMTVWTR
jgi:hypothetical protein